MEVEGKEGKGKGKAGPGEELHRYQGPKLEEEFSLRVKGAGEHSRSDVEETQDPAEKGRQC